jgi:hypothetical protein
VVWRRWPSSLTGGNVAAGVGEKPATAGDGIEDRAEKRNTY